MSDLTLIDLYSFWRIYARKGRKSEMIGTIVKRDGESERETKQRIETEYEKELNDTITTIHTV